MSRFIKINSLCTDISCYRWHRWEVMIWRELKKNWNGTMLRKTTDDFKTKGWSHNHTNNKKNWSTTEGTSPLCWSQITHYPHEHHVCSLSYKLHNAAPCCSSERSTEDRGSCSPLFFCSGRVWRSQHRFNHMWGKPPPLLFPFSPFKPVPVICVTDVWPSIMYT